MSSDKTPEPAVTVTLSGVSGRYALALFDLARDTKQLDAVEGDLSSLEGMIADSDDLAALVTSPLARREEQARAFDAISQAAQLNDLTRRFLGVIIENRRLSSVAEIIENFRQLLSQHRGEVTAEVTSAHKLTAKQVTALQAKLKSMVGHDVRIDSSVDESLLGGLVVKVGSKMIDSSIRTKLTNLQVSMKEVG